MVDLDDGRGAGAPRGELHPPRDVPLGGPRAMTVRRTLPLRGRSLIGSWCFVDHFGPDPVAATGGMRVPRHPHTGLATVTWLFSGEVEHLDSAGGHVVVRPGQVNLMVAGRGVSHQEFSTPATDVLHGTQLWFALPEATRHREPSFEHHVPDPVLLPGAQVRVFIGSLAGVRSPVRTWTAPLVGAEVVLEAGARLSLRLDAEHEHGVLPDGAAVLVDGVRVPADHLRFLPPGAVTVELAAGPEPVRLVLIGGEPLGEEIVMWWNFIGRSHEEVVAHRAAWQREIGLEAGDGGSTPPRFGEFPAGHPAPLPAPVLPGVRLKTRG